MVKYPKTKQLQFSGVVPRYNARSYVICFFFLKIIRHTFIHDGPADSCCILGHHNSGETPFDNINPTMHTPFLIIRDDINIWVHSRFVAICVHGLSGISIWMKIQHNITTPLFCLDPTNSSLHHSPQSSRSPPIARVIWHRRWWWACNPTSPAGRPAEVFRHEFVTSKWSGDWKWFVCRSKWWLDWLIKKSPLVKSWDGTCWLLHVV